MDVGGPVEISVRRNVFAGKHHLTTVHRIDADRAVVAPPRKVWRLHAGPCQDAGFVAERAEVGEFREALFGVRIPERPGAFRQFCAALGPRVITEFNYRLNSRSRAEIFVGMSTRSREDAREVLSKLNAMGYETSDLTGSEMAKLHVRHMVGGHAQGVQRERLCRFEFPERPGALLQFLDTLGGRWNISLFHYRNHGSDAGRVLAAFEVPPSDDAAFEGFLADLGYFYQVADGDEAYRRFLGPA